MFSNISSCLLMNSWNTPKDPATVAKTIAALKEHNIEAKTFSDPQNLKEEVFSLLPEGAEVMNMTSVTLDELGISKEIVDSGKYKSVREEIMGLDRNTQHLERLRLGSAPEYTIGSVHAVTQTGDVLIASNSGSQLAAYVYGSPHVIWVVGTQKIVADTNEGMKRIYEYTLERENERALKAYGSTSNVSKLLIINKETTPGRIHLLFLEQNIGF